MLLKHRAPEINTAPVHLRRGLEHLDKSWIEVLRWLNAIKLDYVLVGPVAHAIRGDASARGPVAIVPAPYGRNFERLATALVAQHAGLRSDRGRVVGGSLSVDRTATVPVKLSGDKLARGRRWMLRFGAYDLDVEGAGRHAAGARGATAERGDQAPAPGYQELLYEAGRFELAEGLSVEVASPEDLEHYSHVRRTGTAPEFRVTRTASSPDDAPSSPGEVEQPPASPADETVDHAVDQAAERPEPADPQPRDTPADT
jgi:hypothetical protein